MSDEKKQQTNNKQMSINHSEGTTETCQSADKTAIKRHHDFADLRRDGIFHLDSEAVFPAVTNLWEVAALFDSERNL
ncbi:MAG: hypothetical protein CVU99_07655 [Firmicutes bacterium HGW-Firmicutes-4]|nr:MAG: hypothetical protein CVU99_07655 [Firmicutes bacterium HGW-Firmicutes-4]